jgi:hypothetical protein
MAVGHAAAAFSVIVPQNPHASFWVAGICVVVVIVGSVGVVVSMNT